MARVETNDEFQNNFWEVSPKLQKGDCKFLEHDPMASWGHSLFQTYLKYLFLDRTMKHGGIFAPPPGTEPVPLAVEARSLDHWTLREVPLIKLKV